MRFGYGLITCQRYPGDSAGDGDLYAEAIDLSQEMEDLGFDSVWTSEHHFADDAYMPSLLPLSAAIAARTEHIQIGTGLLLAPLYPPLRLAEDAATVDLISGGRLILGLGLGWLDWEFEAFGVPMSERVSRTVEAVRTCREAWGDGLVESAGVAVTPKPHRPGGPPIWIGAQAEPAIRRAARLADGWMAGEPSTGEFADQVAWLADEISSLDRGLPEVSGYWPVFVWDGDDAWDRVAPYLYYMEWKYEDAVTAKGRLAPLPLPPELDPHTGPTLLDSIICGTPDYVAARIRALRDIAGPNFTFIGRLYYPGMDREIMRRSTRLFAEEVMPLSR